MIQAGMLRNFPVTMKNVDNAMYIYGPSVASLKGKTTRSRPQRTYLNILAVPPGILENYQNINIQADVMYINKMPFLVTISDKIGFTTLEHLPNCQNHNLHQGVRNVSRVYRECGFKVISADMDNAFAYIEQDLWDEKISPNFVSASEHVAKVERRNRVIKERARAMRHSLPFKCIPKLMLRELVKFVVLWLNAFPTKGGPLHISPHEIVTGVALDYEKHCKLDFGSYVQTHEETHIRNGTEARTCGVIALGPNMSSRSGYWFMSLLTGKRIHRRKWTSLPMPSEVVSRVVHLAQLENQPELLTFCDRHGDPMKLPDDIVDIEPPIVSDEDDQITGVDNDDQLTGVDNDVPITGVDDDMPMTPSEDKVNEPDCSNRTVETYSEEVDNTLTPGEEVNEPGYGENNNTVVEEDDDGSLQDDDAPELPVMRRSSRVPNKILRLVPSFSGKSYKQALVQTNKIGYDHEVQLVFA